MASNWRSTALPYPDVSRNAHATVFGGVRDDIIVLNLGTPLRSPVSLSSFLAGNAPELVEDISGALEEIIHCRAGFITFFQWGDEPLLRKPNGESGSEKSTDGASIIRSNSSKTRMSKRSKSSSYPIVTRRFPCVSNPNEILLPTGTTKIRFHLHPKRFPVATIVDFRSRILDITLECPSECANRCDGQSAHLSPATDSTSRVISPTDYLAVNKPAGIPTEPVASNYSECLHVLIAEALCKNEESECAAELPCVLPLNRIDLFTSGTVFLARNKEAVKRFNKWQEHGQIKKIYRLLVSAPAGTTADDILFGPCRRNRWPGESLVTHWMPQGASYRMAAPRLVRATPAPRWKAAITKIRQVTQLIQSPTENLAEDAVGFCEQLREAFRALVAAGFPTLFDIEAELITGRTHQLRAQFAAMGFPLVNDSMYEPLRGFYADNLDSERVTATVDCSSLIINGAVPDGLTEPEKFLMDCIHKTKCPQAPFGLQSHCTELPKGLRACSGPPWWEAGLY